MINYLKILFLLILAFSTYTTAALANDVEETNEEQVEVSASDFQSVDAVMIEKGTSLYSDNTLLNVAAIWNSEETINRFTIEGDVIAINIASRTYYVAPQFLKVAEQTNVYESKVVGYVRVNQGVTIYSKPQTSSPLLTFSEQARIEVTGVEGDYFIVKAASTKAYILKKDIFIDLNKTLKVLTPTDIKSGSKTVAAMIATGVFKASSVNGTTYTVNGSYKLTSNNVVESEKTTPFANKPNTKYKVTLTSKKAAGLFYKNGDKFAEIPANTEISLINITDKYGIIEMLGSYVYVNLADFKHKDLITGDKVLSFEEMSYKLKVFALLYPEFVTLEGFGKTVEGRSMEQIK